MAIKQQRKATRRWRPLHDLVHLLWICAEHPFPLVSPLENAERKWPFEMLCCVSHWHLETNPWNMQKSLNLHFPCGCNLGPSRAHGGAGTQSVDEQLRQRAGQMDTAAAWQVVPTAWGEGQPCSWWLGASAHGGNVLAISACSCWNFSWDQLTPERWHPDS